MKEKILMALSGIITRMFHTLYYGTGKRTWMQTTWLGTPLLKCPLDLWIYQEMIYELKPDVIIETGTHKGGSAMFMAYLLDSIGKGKIVTIDIAPLEMPKHPRVDYIIGSSTADETISKVKGMIKEGDKVLIILDSDHRRDHVLEELRKYNALATKGSYIIVEDSNVGGHPVYKRYGPGPYEAIEAFLSESAGKNFSIDKSREKFYLTFNPNGYLKKIN
jgi:cephalosporin hydroxylase